MNTIVCGKNAEFIRFLKEAVAPAQVRIAETVQEALKFAFKNEVEALFLLPDYDLSKNSIDEFSDEVISALATLIDKGNTKIYIENYSAFDARDAGILGFKKLTSEMPLGRTTIKLLDEFSEATGTQILQKRNGIFTPNTETRNNVEVLLEIRNCLGVHRIVTEDAVSSGSALGRINNIVYTAMVDFTNFDGRFALPYNSWKRFYAKLFGEILDIDACAIENAFEKVYPAIRTQKELSYKRGREERKEALEKAVINAVNWHLDSGLLPASDGSKGVYEMIRSFDLNVAKNLRGDSALFTAALLMLAGKYFDNQQWQKISENIIEKMLYESELQIKNGPNKGLFKWFNNIGQSSAATVYLSDTSRCANCIYSIYTITGNEALKEALIRCGEAILSWFDGDGLINGGICLDTVNTNLETIKKIDNKNNSAEVYEAAVIFLKNLYDITGDERYKQQIIKTADAISVVHPDYGVYTSHSRNFTLSRALTVYVVAQTFKKDGWTKEINDILEYFHSLMHPCGGIGDGEAYFDENSLNRNMEFAVGFGPEYGNVCDLMYCQNTVFYTLNILRKNDSGIFNRAIVAEMFEKSVDFLLNIQIASDDKRIDGGWMRAYDMDLCEYYGCDKDYAWGAYSILAGWVTGAIPIVFLDILGMKTMY